MTSTRALTVYPGEYITLVTQQVEEALTQEEVADSTIESLEDKVIGPLIPLPANWFAWKTLPEADFIDYSLTRYLTAYVRELQVDDGWHAPGDPLRDELITMLWGPMSESKRQLLISGIQELIRLKLILRKRWPETFKRSRY
jgi:hypothetical protein